MAHKTAFDNVRIRRCMDDSLRATLFCFSEVYNFDERELFVVGITLRSDTSISRLKLNFLQCDTLRRLPQILLCHNLRKQGPALVKTVGCSVNCSTPSEPTLQSRLQE